MSKRRLTYSEMMQLMDTVDAKIHSGVISEKIEFMANRRAIILLDAKKMPNELTEIIIQSTPKSERLKYLKYWGLAKDNDNPTPLFPKQKQKKQSEVTKDQQKQKKQSKGTKDQQKQKQQKSGKKTGKHELQYPSDTPQPSPKRDVKKIKYRKKISNGYISKKNLQKPQIIMTKYKKSQSDIHVYAKYKFENNEFEITKQLATCSNIPKMINTNDDIILLYNKGTCLTEYIWGKRGYTFKSWLKSSLNHRQKFKEDLFKAINCIWDKGYIHGDLGHVGDQKFGYKRNILYDGNDFYVIDFGLMFNKIYNENYTPQNQVNDIYDLIIDDDWSKNRKCEYKN